MRDGLSDEAKVRKDLLWGMYTDARAHARHAETLRTNVVNFVIVVASALIAVIANDGNVTKRDLPLCLVIMVVGVIGVGFSASYTELHERNRRRAVAFRTSLDDEYFQGESNTIAGVLARSDEEHRNSRLHRRVRMVIGSTQRFWLIVPILLATTGASLTVFALAN
ncbi:hypothetical protein [Actinokineospora globicatena]|uniref:Uncharacterized protein n=1 Tax=Actinokineospora globicatena TaxID=103729 RepID=A0A9W6V8Y3_9PSEU|nr:hypothetical protein [Actinokineospora globicatena]GLW90408.1 hypothetical protein Aglo03_12240 [Actinokineospora globicatena]